MDDTSEQLARFEQMGEEAVRLNVNTRKFNSLNHILAIKWLAGKAQKSELRREASQAEQIEIARSAKDAAWTAADAAWEAARAAKTANKIAIAALVAAAVAITVSIISLLRSYHA